MKTSGLFDQGYAMRRLHLADLSAAQLSLRGGWGTSMANMSENRVPSYRVYYFND